MEEGYDDDIFSDDLDDLHDNYDMDPGFLDVDYDSDSDQYDHFYHYEYLSDVDDENFFMDADFL